ncbi:MAG: GNAT family N-acetyltransferase [Chloroflexota bacterium]
MPSDYNNHIIKTERLVLRPLVRTDAEDLHVFYSHPEAMRFMDSPPHTTLAQTKEKLAQELSHSTFKWAICLSEDTEEGGPAIGMVGYIGNPGIPGMGYYLHPDYWQQGYMTEAVRATLAYGFSPSGMDLTQVELWINEKNIASQQLAHKIGFTRRGQFRMKYPHEASAHDKLVFV